MNLDGKELASLRRQHYWAFPVSSGAHQITTGCPSLCGMPEMTIDVDFSSGKTYYFIVQPDVILGSETNKVTTTVQQIDEPYAKRLLQTYVLGKAATQ